MVRKYQRKTDRQQWCEDNMALAIKEILKGSMGYRKAARSFSVPQTTLEARVKRARQCDLSPESAAEKRLGRYQTVFSEPQERELEAYVAFLKERLFGVTWRDIRKLAFEYAERNGVQHPFSGSTRMAGKEWTSNFLRRHPHLSSKAEKTPMSNVSRFLDLLSAIYVKYQFPPGSIYCVAEAGVSTAPCRPSKLYASKGTRPGPTSTVALPESKKGEVHVTVEVCANAAGSLMPPMFVFPKIFKADNPLLMDDAPLGSSANYQENGANEDTFLMWFKQFVDYSHPSSERPVLLILDGHASHTKSLELIEMARDNQVVLCSPPRHLQPLDLFIMGSLSTAYDQEVQDWLLANPRKDVTIYQIGKLFNSALARASAMQSVKEGFEKTGIYPFNVGAFFANGYDTATDVTQGPELMDYEFSELQSTPDAMLIGESAEDSSLITSLHNITHIMEGQVGSTLLDTIGFVSPSNEGIKSEANEICDSQGKGETAITDCEKQLDVQEEFEKFRKACKGKSSAEEAEH